MFIDTHCHLSVEDYDDIDQVIQDNRNVGISNIVISGCSYDSIIESLDIASHYEDVYVTIGYHPDQVDVTDDAKLEFLKEKLSTPKVIGIGEIGLDYHYGKENREAQIALFKRQLKIAEEYHLPVVIHSRDAVEDTIECLKKYKVHGIMHCFSGSVETARIYNKMGLYLGIGGVVTFKNSKLYQVVEDVGLDHIVLETDSPYLAPEPVRGTKNTSKNIPYIAECIANILNVSVEEVSKKTLENTSNVFDLI
ncbi:MAG: TatD family hydrolase [Bacilli bacterium]|nr:TatD family hydrolase [Bacilli bacterium]